MSDRRLVAGVDIATAEVRVEVVDGRGRPHVSASAPLPGPVRGAGGVSEQDAAAWWPAVRRALAECTARLGNRRNDLRALAICATSGTVAAVDQTGAPVRPALMYDDHRARRQAELARRVGAPRWKDLGFTPSASSGLAHLAWLAESEPTAHLVHTPEVIAWRLAGHPVATDSSHALKSGYDPLHRQWAEEVLDALGIDRRRVPEVVLPTRPLGVVCAEASAATGVPVGCEIRAGMTDGCAGQLASGAVEPGQAVSVLGTTLVVKAVSVDPVHDPSGVVYSHRHPDGGWLPGGASNTGGEALADVPAERLGELDRAAAERGPSGVICYPLRRAGERFPFRAERARGFVLGVPADQTDLHRARLEGVAFCERLALERLGELGVGIDGPIRAAGGGARSAVWCRIRASVLGKPIDRVTRAGTALGAALLAATGTVHADISESAAHMLGEPERFEPIEAEIEPLTTRYERFRRELADRGWLC